MIHHSQRLPLLLEARDDLPGAYEELDDLQGDAALHRLLLLGEEHDPEPTFADLLQEAVGADPVAGTLLDRGGGWRGGGCRLYGWSSTARGRRQELFVVFRGQHAEHAADEVGLVGADLRQPRLTSVHRQRRGPLEQFAQTAGVGLAHGGGGATSAVGRGGG